MFNALGHFGCQLESTRDGMQQNHQPHTSLKIQAQMDFASTYLKLLSEAIARIPSFGMTRESLINAQTATSARIDQAFGLLQLEWRSMTRDRPAQFDDQCVILSSRIFAYLIANGINADIVIGTVRIHGKQAYACTVESLKAAALNPGGEGDRVELHAWVSLGGDTIIDGAIASYLVGKFGWPNEYDRKLLMMSAGEFSEDAGIEYHPLIVGSQYIAISNPPDPWELVETLKRRVNRIR